MCIEVNLTWLITVIVIYFTLGYISLSSCVSSCISDVLIIFVGLIILINIFYLTLQIINMLASSSQDILNFWRMILPDKYLLQYMLQYSIMP